MKQNCNVWNTLHDGVITNIEGNVVGDLSLTIQIDYLAKRLSGSYDSVKIKLHECSVFNYELYDSKEEIKQFKSLEEIKKQQPILLSCECEKGVLLIACASGIIKCKYASSELFLLNNKKISYQILSSECELYWDEWEKKA